MEVEADGEVVAMRLSLLLYLPGSGEIGIDLSRQFSQRTIFERVCSPVFQMNHPCHFLALSPPEGVTTLLGGVPGHPTADQGLLMSAVDAVVASCAHPPVDTNRLYATGLSFGGGCRALFGRGVCLHPLYESRTGLRLASCDGSAPSPLDSLAPSPCGDNRDFMLLRRGMGRQKISKENSGYSQ